MAVDQKRDRHQHIFSATVQIVFLVSAIAYWFFLVRFVGVNPILLPDPQAVWQAFWALLASGDFWPALKITLSELAFAFTIAVCLGTVSGYLVSRSAFATQVFEPLFSSLFAIPIILFLPLYVLIFGLGPASKIALGATISFFPITLSTIAGLRGVDQVHITAARSMGANGVQMFADVLLPAALPVIVSGLRMGFTIALLSIIGSETIASMGGLGHKIVNMAEVMNMPLMFAYIVFVVMIAVILNFIVSRIEKRMGRF